MGCKGVAGYVYFIQAANGLTKIGYTTNDIGRRFKEIDAMSPIDLELIGYIKDPFARLLERELHQILCDQRVRNEWFELSLEIIDRIRERYGFVEVMGFYRNGKYCFRKIKYVQSSSGQRDVDNVNQQYATSRHHYDGHTIGSAYTLPGVVVVEEEEDPYIQ